MPTKVINNRLDQFFGQFSNVQYAVNTLLDDMDTYGIVDVTASKLLALASCHSASQNERLNAAKAAFKRIFN
ncbi:hypothetical protein D3C86_821210 [compost metagenome]